MSEIKVNSIKGVGASTAAITVNNSDGTATANLTNRTNKNLIINGAMNVAQRGTSSTSTGYFTVDRFANSWGGHDEALTQAQVDVSAGTTPYTLGFRKALKFTNGNQTSTDAGDIVYIEHQIEGQDIANSGWNYTSSSSFITLSFWVKSSVSQDFKAYIRARDGTSQIYPFSTGTLSADTWTKVTKNIPGNSNLTFDNDNGGSFQMFIWPYIGTQYTDSGVTENAWTSYASASRTPVSATTWWTTNDATFEVTGFQLEVGSVATDFEHRSYAQELQLCKRYCQVIGESGKFIGHPAYYRGSTIEIQVAFHPELRANPTFSATSGSDYYYFYRDSGFDEFDAWTDIGSMGTKGGAVYSNHSSVSVTTTGKAGGLYTLHGKLTFSAEL